LEELECRLGRKLAMSGYTDFATLLDALSALSAKIEGKTAIFFSGTDSSGVRNRGNAGQCVANNPDDCYVMEETNAGRFLDNEVESAFGRGEITQAL
jgi:hypothetical protein